MKIKTDFPKRNQGKWKRKEILRERVVSETKWKPNLLDTKRKSCSSRTIEKVRWRD